MQVSVFGQQLSQYVLRIFWGYKCHECALLYIQKANTLVENTCCSFPCMFASLFFPTIYLIYLSTKEGTAFKEFMCIYSQSNVISGWSIGGTIPGARPGYRMACQYERYIQ